MMFEHEFQHRRKCEVACIHVCEAKIMLFRSTKTGPHNHVFVMISWFSMHFNIYEHWELKKTILGGQQPQCVVPVYVCVKQKSWFRMLLKWYRGLTCISTFLNTENGKNNGFGWSAAAVCGACVCVCQAKIMISESTKTRPHKHVAVMISWFNVHFNMSEHWKRKKQRFSVVSSSRVWCLCMCVKQNSWFRKVQRLDHTSMLLPWYRGLTCISTYLRAGNWKTTVLGGEQQQCVLACICICMYTCIYICIQCLYMYRCACLFACKYCMYMYLCVCIHTKILCLCLNLWMEVMLMCIYTYLGH